MYTPENTDQHREVTMETLKAPPREAKPAHLTRRVAAMLADSLILTAMWMVFTWGTSASLTIGSTTTLTVYLGIVSFLYYSLMEGIFAATLGKFLFKLRVNTAEGDLCSINAALIRNLARFVDWLPVFYILGLLSLSMSPKRQRLGDRLAKTIVSPALEKDINPPSAPFLFH